MDRGCFELVLDVRCRLGECPVWSAKEGALWFTDITGRQLHRFRPDAGDHDVVPADEEVGCLALVRGGGLIVGSRSGIWLLGTDGTRLRQLGENPEDTTASRFNDGRVDPQGRFWLGTIDETRSRRSAHLYRFDRRGLRAIESDILTSNGLAFSPDGKWMYHADTRRWTVYRYAFDGATGTAHDREVFVEFDKDAKDRARPDGAAVDAEGCYWTALYEGGRVQRYSPRGKLLGEYQVPTRSPTMPAFGGPDLKTLYVTTAREGSSKAELGQPSRSGGLFSMRVDVPGLPEPEFDPDI